MTHSDSKNLKNEKCQICKDLLANLHQFFDMLNNADKHNRQWLTVEDVAKELKISKSIVYRLIRNGELNAVNIVENNGRIARKGHYRIHRHCLENYLQSKKVNPLPAKSTSSHQSRHLYQVKNHLGL